ncbi:GAF domain-containing protein [bacterium]|nr:GAF domain-containing protein [bacterium]
MADIIKWPVIFACPGEEDLPLLADLAARSDAQIVAVADRDRSSLGAGLAEVMGLTVIGDLAEVPAGQARYLIYPRLDDEVAAFVDLAPEFGLEALPVSRFTHLIADPSLRRPDPAPRSRKHPDHEALETETAAIHRTLSRIEEALDREALLRWLLGLAARATGGASGSIMLLDPASEELYVAFAHGLSQQTMHRTRVRLGEGIAGRVARNRQAEMITSNQHPGARRDRSAAAAAVCAPLVWDGRLLGVLNISAAPDQGGLNPDALSVIESLSHRFGMILDRFLRIQMVKDGDLFRAVEDDLTSRSRDPEALASTLSRWAEGLGRVAGADSASLSVLTGDGDLLVADPGGHRYESPLDPVKAEVLAEARARVLRPGDLADRDPVDTLREATIFHLPVGRDPAPALFTVAFNSAARAHHFQTISGEIMNLISRHLRDYLERVALVDQVDRLTTLATSLSDLALGTEGPPEQDRVLGAACRLTGAGKAYLLLRDPQQDILGDDGGPDDLLRREAGRLLGAIGQRGWQATTIGVEDLQGGEGSGPRRSLLVVPLQRNAPFPGLVLIDKERLHPLDGWSFSEFDALFVRRLLPFLEWRRRQTGEGEARAPVPSAPTPAPQPQAPAVLPAPELQAVLRREMDRCDRYHTCLGLAAFRLEWTGDQPLDLSGLVRDLEPYLRSSDYVFPHRDDTVLVLVPEDVQSLPKLQDRVEGIIRRLSGRQDLTLRSAARPYPGGAASINQLLEAVLGLVA